MRRADTTSLRSHNSQLLLRLLREHQPTSARILTARTGMQASTISRLLKTLSARGLTQSHGLTSDSGAGRPAELWGINGAFGASMGLYLASNLVAGMSTDLNGNLLASCVIPFRDPEAQTSESLLALLQQALARLEASERVKAHPLVGVGIASMGLVDRASNSLQYFNATVDLARLAGEGDWPLHLENDANAVARGEAAHGVLTGVSDAVVLYAHEGIGAGLLLNGALNRGAGGAAGEVGYRETQLVSNPLDGDDFQIQERFRTGVCNMVNLLNPEALLLTGDLSLLPPAFLTELEESVRAHTNPVARKVRILSEPCDPMGVARHMAMIVLDEEVFAPPSLLTRAPDPIGEAVP